MLLRRVPAVAGFAGIPAEGTVDARVCAPSLLQPPVLSEIAISEWMINFLYLINPVNPRSFMMGQKVCSARVASRLRPGWSRGLCVGIPWAWRGLFVQRPRGSADRLTQLLFWVQLQLTSLSDEIGGSGILAHLLSRISLSFTANLRYLTYEVKTSGLS